MFICDNTVKIVYCSIVDLNLVLSLKIDVKLFVFFSYKENHSSLQTTFDVFQLHFVLVTYYLCLLNYFVTFVLGILWCLDKDMEFTEDSGNEDCDMEEGSSVDKGNLDMARQPGTPIQFSGLHLEQTMDSLTANLFQDPTLSNKLE